MLVKVILTVQTGSEEQTVVTASQSFRHQEIRRNQEGMFSAQPATTTAQRKCSASVELLLH